MNGQLSIFDWKPELMQEPDVGVYMESAGANIPHVMRASYIGRKVAIDVSTESRTTFQVGILEKYFWNEFSKTWRSVVYTGKQQRSLIDHYEWNPRSELREVLPWECYEARKKAIGKTGGKI